MDYREAVLSPSKSFFAGLCCKKCNAVPGPMAWGCQRQACPCENLIRRTRARVSGTSATVLPEPVGGNAANAPQRRGCCVTRSPCATRRAKENLGTCSWGGGGCSYSSGGSRCNCIGRSTAWRCCGQARLCARAAANGMTGLPGAAQPPSAHPRSCRNAATHSSTKVRTFDEPRRPSTWTTCTGSGAISKASSTLTSVPFCRCWRTW